MICQAVALPEAERRTRLPTITDPRELDVAAHRRPGQIEAMAALEQRAARALRVLGVLMATTRINDQTLLPPT